MEKENKCIFCKIVRGEIPSVKIYEDENIFAFMDIAPANPGHAMVIPKGHFETLVDIPDDLANDMTLLTKKIARAAMSALAAEGFNIAMNNKQVAGQVVPHAHIHIIPRFKGDGQHIHWKPNLKARKSVETSAEKIRSFL